jgi:hypothetical protein
MHELPDRNNSIFQHEYRITVSWLVKESKSVFAILPLMDIYFSFVQCLLFLEHSILPPRPHSHDVVPM